MKIRIKKRTELQQIWMWLGMVCIVTFALLEHVGISIPAFSAIKMPLLYLGGICAVFQLKIFLRNILKKRYFYIFAVLLLMCLGLLLSMFQNRGTLNGVSLERTTVRLILYLVELFVLTMAFAEKGQSKAAVRFVFFYVLALVVLTDVLTFSGLLVFGTGSTKSYWIGTKFTVVYMHFNLLALWLMLRWNRIKVSQIKKWIIWVLAAVVAVVAVYVDCMSGVLGSIFLAALLVWMSSAKNSARTLTSPAIFLLWILACTLIVFVISFVLSFPFIESFIEDVLRRSTTLTGRVKIYLHYAEAMKDHWLLGYGYGSGNLISMHFFRCANAQNAVLHWILQSGLVVTTLLIMLLTMIMKRVNLVDKMRKLSIEPLIALVYTYVLLGTVEITYSTSFLLWMALMFMVVNDMKWNSAV